MKKDIKNLKEWNESGLDFDEYVAEPCRIARDIVDDLQYYVGTINDFENKIYQINEAQDRDEDGNLTYSTFAEKDGKIYFLGEFADCSENDISDCLKIIEDIEKENK